MPSTDGTIISYLARGSGPRILGIHGGLGSALSLQPLAQHLADDFQVVTMNCRGHGTSEWGQSPPHIAREVEDVLAVIDAVGPITALFGYSYGAVLALETALAAADCIPRLALYEPPLPITYPIPDLAALETALAAGNYEQLLLNASVTGGGFSPTELAALREDPLWLAKVAHAPTLVPTMRVLAGLEPTVEQYAEVTAPTKLIVGTTSAPYLLQAADQLAAVMPHLTRDVLHGQGHHVDQQLLAQSLERFLRT
ncbi:alpha/beta hydrolase [Nocardia amamiensis]|uniref:Alpha/beta hydrolase n=1 Tax=Nocardia amamiensis TaxID=404578 RepID=A0ABS0D234_9NOCA|nr:alpha/beta hydrolase [Nocardia amamiensis]MBF6302896.1 alpha/beta hydrolase [Nocardia amamiensis]